MVTLDQVLLLERKVENAVQKIEQLKAENDALRSKCAELTNALSAKTEQFSSFESDQNKIEAGILNALSKLSEIENSIIDISEKSSDSQESDAADESSDVPVEQGEEGAASEEETQSEEQPSSDADAPEQSDAQSENAEPTQNEQNDLFSDDSSSSGEDLGGQFEKVSGTEPAPENNNNQADLPNSNPFDIF